MYNKNKVLTYCIEKKVPESGILMSRLGLGEDLLNSSTCKIVENINDNDKCIDDFILLHRLEVNKVISYAIANIMQT